MYEEISNNKIQMLKKQKGESMRKQWKFLSGFILILMIFTAGIGFAEEKETIDIENLKNQSLKVNMDDAAYKKKDMSRYIDLVWNRWVKKEFTKEEIKMYKISREDIYLTLVYLNNDSTKDVIATIAKPYVCGKFGRDCEIKILISTPSRNYKMVNSCMSVFIEDPIYILKSETNGLKDIILNNKFLLKFNGKEYCN
jgi:hypothetical protein